MNLSTTPTDLSPNARQHLFWLSPEKFICYGGAKGGGKSWAIRTKQILRRWKYPNSKGLLLRRTYPQLFRTHVMKIKEEWPMLKYNDQKHTFTFPNGSYLELGSANTEGDILDYQGAEYDDIGIDQAEEFTEYQYDILRSCLRTTRVDLKTHMYLGANPGGVGHGWVKRNFIEVIDDPDKRYIPARVYDNPVLLTADPSYLSELEKLPEGLRRAYLEGDWTIFAGQVFSEFRLENHVITEFPTPLRDTKRIICFDWGYNAPGAALYLAYTKDGHVFAYREIYQNAKTPYEWAMDMKQYTEKIEYILLPHDCFAKVHGNESIADIFKRELGIPIRAAGTLVQGARHQRVAITHQYLSIAPDGRPWLQIHAGCKNTIRTLPEMIYDKSDPEDVDTTGEDHCYDALSTGLMERVNRAMESGAVKYEDQNKKEPEAWTADETGAIAGQDFLQGFKDAAVQRRSTTGIER